MWCLFRSPLPPGSDNGLRYKNLFQTSVFKCLFGVSLFFSLFLCQQLGIDRGHRDTSCRTAEIITMTALCVNRANARRLWFFHYPYRNRFDIFSLPSLSETGLFAFYFFTVFGLHLRQKVCGATWIDCNYFSGDESCTAETSTRISWCIIGCMFLTVWRIATWPTSGRCRDREDRDESEKDKTIIVIRVGMSIVWKICRDRKSLRYHTTTTARDRSTFDLSHFSHKTLCWIVS